MAYQLVIVEGESKGKTLEIHPPTIIGRSKQADITVGQSLVSRKHCEITTHDDGMLVVEDLGSLNGTFHGGQRIEEPVYLEPGDRLTVGSITFEARYGDPTGLEETPAVDETADFEFVPADTPADGPAESAGDEEVAEVEEEEEFEEVAEAEVAEPVAEVEEAGVEKEVEKVEPVEEEVTEHQEIAPADASPETEPAADGDLSWLTGAPEDGKDGKDSKGGKGGGDDDLDDFFKGIG